MAAIHLKRIGSIWLSSAIISTPGPASAGGRASALGVLGVATEDDDVSASVLRAAFLYSTPSRMIDDHS